MADDPLAAWGWDAGWEAVLAKRGGDGLEPARVIGQDRDRWTVRSRDGTLTARLPSSRRIEPFPAVGDWVLVRPGPSPSDPLSVARVLPRRSVFSRGAPGNRPGEQTVAANVDRVWIVHGLDLAPNPRRLERYLALAWESGAIPEVVLTKADLGADIEEAIRAVEGVAPGVGIQVVSALDGTGMDGLLAGLGRGSTVALLGPSGVGKSSLVNRLAEAQLAATGEVRSTDRKGRHTTRRRELFMVAGGALLLDTPGMRELQLGELETGLDRAFPEIEELAERCRFRDCAHEAEPGCAVLEAAASGGLPADRLDSWRKLRAEAAWEARRSDPLARAEAVAEHKAILKSLRLHPKYRDR